MSTKFNLSIDLFTPDVRDAADVSRVLRDVAAQLGKFVSTTWSPYALSGTIYAEGTKRPIGTWSVDSATEADLKIAVTPTPPSPRPESQRPLQRLDPTWWRKIADGYEQQDGRGRLVRQKTDGKVTGWALYVEGEYFGTWSTFGEAKQRAATATRGTAQS